MPIEVDGEMCEADKGSQWVGGVDPKCYLLCSDDDNGRQKCLKFIKQTLSLFLDPNTLCDFCL